MALSLLPVHDQIVTKLEELPQTVYSTGVPDDTALEYDTNGMLLPYIVASFSGLIQNRLERGITGPRQDLGRSYVAVSCVGPTERSARQVLDLVIEKLTGFQPTDAGYLSPDSVGKPYIDSDTGSRPIRYVAETVFTFPVNTVVS